MTLTGKQKNYLRGIAHNLNPVVMIGGKGLTDAVMNEIELALNQHELIKIKLPSNEKSEKVAIVAQITRKAKKLKSRYQVFSCLMLDSEHFFKISFFDFKKN